MRCACGTDRQPPRADQATFPRCARLARVRQEATRTMGAGTPLTYAIGDIHGRLDLLTILLAQIEQHRAGRDRTIVFLGDYIDRGPDSAGVIATVRRLQAREPDAIVCLKGNHEDLMLKAYRDESKVDLWVMNGSYETMISFGPRCAGRCPAMGRGPAECP